MTILAFGPWQALLDGMGWVLARIYDVIPNFGLSIIVLTIIIRVVLLPLGIKQIKSMQHMQAIQPKIKALQKKYKNDKQKQQEETMKLYKEAGVNPLGGCLPLLLQFPILIAMYQILRAPVPNAEYVSATETPDVPAVVNNHYPTDSTLYLDVTSHDASGTSFLLMNLQCSLVQAGTQVTVLNSDGEPTDQNIDCGSGSKVVATIPYAMLLVLMVGTTFFQQRQMTKASPPGAQSAQQQAIMKFMPLMFAFFGLSFPAGLVLYWTTSNVFQIGQQAFLLRAGHIGPDALERRIAEQKARAESAEPKKGLMAKMMEKAESAQQAQKTQGGGGKGGAAKPAKRTGGTAKPAKRTGGARPSGGSGSWKSSGRGGGTSKGSGTSKGEPNGAEDEGGANGG